MNVPRASLWMLAALAAGTGARLGVRELAKESPPRRETVTRNGKTVNPAAPDSPVTIAAGPRPAAEEVLAASGASRLRRLLAWLPGATEEELVMMAEKLVPDPSGDGLAARLLMTRWAEVNPRGLLKWAEEIENRDHRLEEEGTPLYAMMAWARTDFESAWAAVSGRPLYRVAAILGLSAVNPAKCRDLVKDDPSVLDVFVNGMVVGGDIIRRIAEWNPAEAVALLEGGEVKNRRYLTESVFSAWARSDPAAAIAWMKTLPAGLQSSMTGVVDSLSRSAPRFIPALLEGLPPGNLRSSLLSADLRRLAAEDPAAAQKRMEDLPNGPLRQFGRVLLMQGALKREDFAAARALADQTGWRMESAWYPSYEQLVTARGSSSGFSYAGEGPLGSFKELMGHVAAADPAAAAEILLKKGFDPKLAEAAAMANPAAVATALTARTDAAETKQALNVLVSAWALRDPAKAAAWVDSCPAGSAGRETATDALSQSWAQIDPAGLLQWAAGRDGAAKTAWNQVAAQAPDYALVHLDEFFAAGSPEGIQSLLTTLDRRPEEARAVLRQMPGDLDVPIENTVKNWVKNQPEEVTAWAEGLEPGLKRDHAAEALARWYGESFHDFEASFQWASALPDESRDRVLRDVASELHSFYEDDPREAKRMVGASPLTPEEKQQLLEGFNDSK